MPELAVGAPSAVFASFLPEQKGPWELSSKTTNPSSGSKRHWPSGGSGS
jgi:hypothetical protein